MVDYLIERPEVNRWAFLQLFQMQPISITNSVSKISSRVEQIEALELVGASFANDKDNYDVGMAYRFLLLISLDLLVNTFCQYLTLLKD